MRTPKRRSMSLGTIAFAFFLAQAWSGLAWADQYSPAPGTIEERMGVISLDA